MGRRRNKDFRKVIAEPWKGSKQSQQRLRRSGLDDESLSFLPHNGILSRKFKLAGNAHSLVSTTLEELYVSLAGGST